MSDRPAKAVWLSPRERQVLELHCCAKQAKDIASELKISIQSVYFHRAGLRKKLKVRTDQELLLWGLQNPEDVYRGVTRSPGLRSAEKRAA